ncbi:MAG: hypothetical protein KDN19_03035 [Verrucomicrobiae bacterium]|nr:hypothetical protein [Verrucomicrobiae bacterium]
MFNIISGILLIGVALSGYLDFLGFSKYPLLGFGCIGIVFGTIRMIKKARLKKRMLERGSLYY